MNRRRVMGCLLLGTIAVAAVSPFAGRDWLPLSALWQDAAESMDGPILWCMRLPRACLAFLAGAGLATSGMAFQAMFRNPLATPFTLGTASGASLGAAVCIHAGWNVLVAGVPSVCLFAFAGALATMLIVYGLSRLRSGFSTATMLLAGVALSFFCSSLILFLQYSSDLSRSYRMIRWVMGGLEGVVSFRGEVLIVLPVVASGCLVLFYLTHELNLISTGEELAAARGVELGRTKTILFFTASLMVGVVVAFCGPIGFVGLMAPHICRLLIGSDHRWLLPATVLFGGAFLVVCDTLARSLLPVGDLPVGILTAMLGGPFFLWLLLRRPGVELSW